MAWRTEEEILAFARQLEGRSIENLVQPSVLETIPNHSGKGGFGQYLENAYFGLETNSYSGPDFHPIPLELKAASLAWKEKKKAYEPKERLVLNIINYNEIIHEASFEESKFLLKNQAILIIWYVYNSSDHFGGYKVTLADIWRCVEEDGVQIKKDWDYIVNKIKAGKAHELSEGDTLFLGVCTKGATAESSYRSQPFSDIPAKQRSFCFKIQYLKSVYRRMLDRKEKRDKGVTSAWFCRLNQSVEDAFREKFAPHIGRNTGELREEFGISDNDKTQYARIARAIIGVEGNKGFAPYRDLQYGDVQLKIVRIERNGKNKESMSFPYIRYCDIADEEWDTCSLKEILTSKFIIPVFVQVCDGNEYILDRVCVWNMPDADLDIVRGVWEDTKAKIIAGDYSHFIGSSEDRIIHIRPHARDSHDLTPTPQGTMEKKKSFWLNRSYILSHVISQPAAYDFNKLY